MERKGLIALILMGMCFAFSYGQRCEPSCDGHAEGDMVEDPRNCTRYYTCMVGQLPSDSPSECNIGMIFDSAIGCVPGTCTHTCPCHLTCISVGDHIADPFDCSVYYVCDINGPGPAQRCTADRPHFDGDLCVDDKSVCCKPGCDPSCEHPSVLQVPDPLDCKGYYMCVNSVLQDRETCPTDKPYFDYTTGHCSSDAVCKILCSDVPDPDSTTTTTTTTTTITTSTTTTTGPCVGSLTCTAAGLFPSCSNCNETYFLCEAAGQPGMLQKCSGDLVFNPEPSYPYCVLRSNCPYKPFE